MWVVEEEVRDPEAWVEPAEVALPSTASWFMTKESRCFWTSCCRSVSRSAAGVRMRPRCAWTTFNSHWIFSSICWIRSRLTRSRLSPTVGTREAPVGLEHRPHMVEVRPHYRQLLRLLLPEPMSSTIRRVTADGWKRAHSKLAFLVSVIFHICSAWKQCHDLFFENETKRHTRTEDQIVKSKKILLKKFISQSKNICMILKFFSCTNVLDVNWKDFNKIWNGILSLEK